MAANKLIRKVYLVNKSNQKLVTIPNNSDIKEGDYVEITKVY